MGSKLHVLATMLALSLDVSPASAAFNLVRTYSGSNFLDQFYFRDVSCSVSNEEDSMHETDHAVMS